MARHKQQNRKNADHQEYWLQISIITIFVFDVFGVP